MKQRRFKNIDAWGVMSVYLQEQDGLLLHQRETDGVLKGRAFQSDQQGTEKAKDTNKV